MFGIWSEHLKLTGQIADWYSFASRKAYRPDVKFDYRLQNFLEFCTTVAILDVSFFPLRAFEPMEKNEETLFEVQLFLNSLFKPMYKWVVVQYAKYVQQAVCLTYKRASIMTKRYCP